MPRGRAGAAIQRGRKASLPFKRSACEMIVEVLPDKASLGRQAAADGAKTIRDALAARGECTIIVATGASQFEMLDALVA